MSREPATNQDRRPGPPGRLRGVLDRSIGMYLVRRVTGRPHPLGGASPVPLLDPDVIARRIGAAAEPAGLHPTIAREPIAREPIASSVPAPVFAAAPPRPIAQPNRPSSRPSPAGPDVVRRRLVRDSGVALVGIASVVLLAVAVWPPAQGRVLGATSRPGEEIVAPSPTPSPVPPTPS